MTLGVESLQDLPQLTVCTLPQRAGSLYRATVWAPKKLGYQGFVEGTIFYYFIFCQSYHPKDMFLQVHGQGVQKQRHKHGHYRGKESRSQGKCVHKLFDTQFSSTFDPRRLPSDLPDPRSGSIKWMLSIFVEVNFFKRASSANQFFVISFFTIRFTNLLLEPIHV